MGEVWLAILKGFAWLMGFAFGMYQALGLIYIFAVLFDFAAIIAEGGAKGKKTKEESEQAEESGFGVAAFVMSALSSLATVFLFVHLLLHSKVAFDRGLQIGAAAIVMFLVLTGSLYGEFIARIAPNFGALCRAVKLPLTVIAFGLTVYATYPSIGFFFGLIARFFS